LHQFLLFEGQNYLFSSIIYTILELFQLTGHFKIEIRTFYTKMALTFCYVFVYLKYRTYVTFLTHTMTGAVNVHKYDKQK